MLCVCMVVVHADVVEVWAIIVEKLRMKGNVGVEEIVSV